MRMIRYQAEGDTFGDNLAPLTTHWNVLCVAEKFLKDDDDNKLQPPHQFMTRKQSLNFA